MERDCVLSKKISGVYIKPENGACWLILCRGAKEVGTRERLKPKVGSSAPFPPLKSPLLLFLVLLLRGRQSTGVLLFRLKTITTCLVRERVDSTEHLPPSLPTHSQSVRIISSCSNPRVDCAPFTRKLGSATVSRSSNRTSLIKVFLVPLDT